MKNRKAKYTIRKGIRAFFGEEKYSVKDIKFLIKTQINRIAFIWLYFFEKFIEINQNIKWEEKITNLSFLTEKIFFYKIIKNI